MGKVLMLSAVLLVALGLPVRAGEQGVPREVTEYLMKVSFIHGKVILLFSQVDKQMSRNKRDLENAPEGPAREALFVERFRQFDLLLADLDGLNEEAAKVVPPAELRQAHVHFLLMIQMRSLGMRLMQMQLLAKNEQYGKAGQFILAGSGMHGAAFAAMLLRAVSGKGEGK